MDGRIICLDWRSALLLFAQRACFLRSGRKKAVLSPRSSFPFLVPFLAREQLTAVISPLLSPSPLSLLPMHSSHIGNNALHTELQQPPPSEFHHHPPPPPPALSLSFQCQYPLPKKREEDDEEEEEGRGRSQRENERGSLHAAINTRDQCAGGPPSKTKSSTLLWLRNRILDILGRIFQPTLMYSTYILQPPHEL